MLLTSGGNRRLCASGPFYMIIQVGGDQHNMPLHLDHTSAPAYPAHPQFQEGIQALLDHLRSLVPVASSFVSIQVAQQGEVISVDGMTLHGFVNPSTDHQNTAITALPFVSCGAHFEESRRQPSGTPHALFDIVVYYIVFVPKDSLPAIDGKQGKLLVQVQLPLRHRLVANSLSLMLDEAIVLRLDVSGLLADLIRQVEVHILPAGGTHGGGGDPGVGGGGGGGSGRNARGGNGGGGNARGGNGGGGSGAGSRGATGGRGGIGGSVGGNDTGGGACGKTTRKRRQGSGNVAAVSICGSSTGTHLPSQFVRTAWAPRMRESPCVAACLEHVSPEHMVSLLMEGTSDTASEHCPSLLAMKCLQRLLPCSSTSVECFTSSKLYASSRDMQVSCDFTLAARCSKLSESVFYSLPVTRGASLSTSGHDGDLCTRRVAATMSSHVPCPHPRIRIRTHLDFAA